MNKIERDTLVTMAESEFLNYMYDRADGWEEVPLSEVRFAVQQYHGCQQNEGDCELCLLSMQHHDPDHRCVETLEQGHIFAEDCIDILNYIEEEGFLNESEFSFRLLGRAMSSNPLSSTMRAGEIT